MRLDGLVIELVFHAATLKSLKSLQHLWRVYIVIIYVPRVHLQFDHGLELFQNFLHRMQGESQEDRLKKLFLAASSRHYTSSDFKDIKKLRELEPGKNGLLEALRRLSVLSLQEFLLKEAQRHYNIRQAFEICSNLTHFSCEQKFGMSRLAQCPDLHLPACLKSPANPNFSLQFEPVNNDLSVASRQTSIESELTTNEEGSNDKYMNIDFENLFDCKESQLLHTADDWSDKYVLNFEDQWEHEVSPRKFSANVNDTILQFVSSSHPKVKKDDYCYSRKDVIDIQNLPSEIAEYVRPDKILVLIPVQDFLGFWDIKNNFIIKRSNYGALIDKYLEKINFPCSFHVWTSYKLSRKNYEKEGMACVMGYCKFGRQNKKHLDEDACETKFKCFIKYNSKLDGKTNPENMHGASGQKLISADENYNVQIEAWLSGKFVLFSRQSTSRPTSGATRQNSKIKLLNDNPLRHHILSHSEVPSLRILHNNFKYASEDAVRKIRSEALGDCSTKSLGILDAMEKVTNSLNTDSRFFDKIKGVGGFVRHQSIIPHITTMYSPQQLRFAATCDEIYFDGTGNVVPKIKDPSDQNKQILLHMAVGRNSHQTMQTTPVPVFEMLSNKGSVPFISQNLLEFVAKVRLVKRKWKPERFVCDFCLSFLHAACFSIVGETPDGYINRKYEILFGKLVDDDLPVLFVCSGHFMHANAKFLRKKCKKAVAVAALHGFAQLVEARNKDDIDHIISVMIELFCSKELTAERQDELMDTLSNNTILPEICELNTADKEEIEYNFEDVELPSGPKLQREKSKFFMYFFNKRQEFEQNIITQSYVVEKNAYMSKDCVDTIQRWMTYLPLWSKATFFGKKACPQNTITTGYVETAIGIFKNNFHTNHNQFEPDLIYSHATFVLNTVIESLRKGRSTTTRHQDEKKDRSEPTNLEKVDDEKLGEFGEIGNAAFATAEWGKKNKSPKSINKTFLPRMKAIKNLSAASNKSSFSKLSSNDNIVKKKVTFKLDDEDGTNRRYCGLSGEKLETKVETEITIDLTPRDQFKEDIRLRLKISKSYWENQTKVIRYLFSSPIIGTGDENDL
ncbi:hypothetical protein Fcan01_26174 [Folsomia candida]|uniref:Uncharacterized protein n=1 Tax=Folsomia candida TaxID=158441 RepID=A0A226D0D2_FOLCA|nr:hypothetical protein Fcan01_26174 [Folsomia candida]